MTDRTLVYTYGSIIFAFVALKLVHFLFIAGGVCHSNVSLEGKTAIVTGANTGIGKETAHDLARRGARVFLASRSEEKTLPVVEEIRAKTGNEQVFFKKLDLARITSIRAFAEDFINEEERLDILVNNAGVVSPKDETTDDGFEIHMGVNHLGHFLLTNLLLDHLEQSGPGSRVVTVSALAALLIGEVDLEDLMNSKGYSHPWFPPIATYRRYANSKLANILFTQELARRLEGTGVNAYSLHPGVIQTELTRNVESSIERFFISVVSYPPFSYLLKTPFEGAQTTICCAVDEALAQQSGLYYADCKATDPDHAQLKDPQLAKKLWDLSAELVKLKEIQLEDS